MKTRNLFIITMIIVSISNAVAQSPSSLQRKAPNEAQVYFIEPSNQANVSGTFNVVFGLRGMGVAPAGIDLANTGHHHLLIDSPSNINYQKSLPASKQILHFGNGQTETKLELSSGKHTLQLVLGDFVHMPHIDPVVSEVITVYVE